MKSSSVDSNHNPRIGEQDVRLLKVLDVLVSTKVSICDKKCRKGLEDTGNSPYLLLRHARDVERCDLR